MSIIQNSEGVTVIQELDPRKIPEIIGSVGGFLGEIRSVGEDSLRK